MYGTRFHSDDMSTKSYFILEMIGMVGICANVPDSYNLKDQSAGHNLPAMAVAAAFCRGVGALAPARIAYHFYFNPSKHSLETGKNPPFTYGLGIFAMRSTATVVWLLVAGGIWPSKYVLWAFGADILLQQCFFLWKFAVAICGWVPESCQVHCVAADGHLTVLPFHLEHYTERLGLIIIIMLGESIDGISVHHPAYTENRGLGNGFEDIWRWREMYFTAGMGFLLIISFKLLYFDCSVVTEDNHVMRQNPRLFVFWDWGHQFLACGLALMGDALAILADKSVVIA